MEETDITSLTPEEREKLFIKATETLIALPEPQLSEYIESVILSIIEALKEVNSLPKLQQINASLVLLHEIAQNSPSLVPAFLYTIKPGAIKSNCPHCKKPIEVPQANFRPFYEKLISETMNSLIQYFLQQA